MNTNPYAIDYRALGFMHSVSSDLCHRKTAAPDAIMPDEKAFTHELRRHVQDVKDSVVATRGGRKHAR
jgi:hypothetical protein